MEVPSPSTADAKTQVSETIETRPQSLDIDYAAEEKLLLKLDCKVLSVVLPSSVYILLDRVNIGNARLQGLEKDLNLSNIQFSIALSVLFVTYVLAEIPSNLIIKRVGLSRWIPAMALMWGIIATCTGFSRNFEDLLALRLLLGLFEGGLFAGVLRYISCFSPRGTVLRLPTFMFSSSVPGIVGGILAYFVIGHMDGIRGYRGWRWIMIFEGIPMCLFAIIAFFTVADGPETARYLSAEEKELFLLWKKRHIEQHHQNTKGGGSGWQDVLFACVSFCCATIIYGYNTFLPSINQELAPAGSVPTAIYLTLICYSVGHVACLIPVVWLVFCKRQERIRPPHEGVAAAAALVACAGYATLLVADSAAARCIGCVLIQLGIQGTAGARTLRHPTLVSTVNMMGIGGGGIVMSFFYPELDGPRYYIGNFFTLGHAFAAIAIVVFLSWHASNVNKRMIAGKEGWEATADQSEELRDRSSRVTYTV